MYIGKSNATERSTASSFGAACDPRNHAGRIEVPTNVGLIHQTTPYWCPSKANPYEYYQISLKEGPTKIGGFLIQGTVTEFEVSYSLNDVNSQYFLYREFDAVRSFTNTPNKIFPIAGLEASRSVYKHTMTAPGSANIQSHKPSMSHPLAQFIRFHPKKWKEGEDLLMKIDLLECVACGDGFRDRMEECDDGNLVDGDGCSGANAVKLGYKSPCSMETHLGMFWCEDRTDGPRRGNALGDCLYRADRATGTNVGGEHVTKAPQPRHFAEMHYADRGGISTGFVDVVLCFFSSPIVFFFFFFFDYYSLLLFWCVFDCFLFDYFFDYSLLLFCSLLHCCSGYNNGILPICDGVVCDGQAPGG